MLNISLQVFSQFHYKKKKRLKKNLKGLKKIRREVQKNIKNLFINIQDCPSTVCSGCNSCQGGTSLPLSLHGSDFGNCLDHRLAKL